MKSLDLKFKYIIKEFFISFKNLLPYIILFILLSLVGKYIIRKILLFDYFRDSISRYYEGFQNKELLFKDLYKGLILYIPHSFISALFETIKYVVFIGLLKHLNNSKNMIHDFFSRSFIKVFLMSFFLLLFVNHYLLQLVMNVYLVVQMHYLFQIPKVVLTSIIIIASIFTRYILPIYIIKQNGLLLSIKDFLQIFKGYWLKSITYMLIFGFLTAILLSLLLVIFNNYISKNIASSLIFDLNFIFYLTLILHLMRKKDKTKKLDI
jgi:hypothetical protein